MLAEVSTKFSQLLKRHDGHVSLELGDAKALAR